MLTRAEREQVTRLSWPKRLMVGVAFTAAIFVMHHYDRPNLHAVHCPTEDSCRPNYDGKTNQWTIEEVTP